MFVALDSSFFRPTPGIAQQARAAGIQGWWGYLATRPNVGLASPWGRADFDAARLCGAKPIAFCSGWDDPVACKNLAADWDVRLAVDVEDGIRGNGPWVQPFLDASGAGLYGNFWCFPGRRAPFYILTAFPGADPNATWGTQFTPRPNGPCGWQWQNTHDELGGGVDRGWYDDWFLEGADMLQDERAALFETLANVKDIHQGMGALVSPDQHPLIFQILGKLGALDDETARLEALKVALAHIEGKIQAPPTLDVHALAAAIVSKLPTGTATLDQNSAATLARAVVDEIGARVKPAAPP